MNLDGSVGRGEMRSICHIASGREMFHAVPYKEQQEGAFSNSLRITKESIIDQTPFSENLPQPLFSKEGRFLPL
jgi:hypothetical protein